MRGDYTQLDLGVTNLLENAARHTSTGSGLRVHAVPHDSCVELDVVDEGPGVDATMRAELFEPFRSSGGTTGIGLAICNAIVDAHGGTIRVDDEHRGGARFVVTLPRAE